jgi:hypothetical protein
MTSEARRKAAAWTRGVRIILGVILLILSVALLIWGFMPARREIRTQPISPAELQLPTPSSLLIQPELVFHRLSYSCQIF